MINYRETVALKDVFGFHNLKICEILSESQSEIKFCVEATAGIEHAWTEKYETRKVDALTTTPRHLDSCQPTTSYVKTYDIV
jgi:hypothetical protein